MWSFEVKFTSIQFQGKSGDGCAVFVNPEQIGSQCVARSLSMMFSGLPDNVEVALTVQSALFIGAAGFRNWLFLHSFNLIKKSYHHY